jgi:RNA polymerase-binding transcription factor DksA
MTEKETRLSENELEQFRKRLAEERGTRRSDLERLTEEHDEAAGRGSAGGGLSDVPTHFADQGTQTDVEMQDAKRIELLRHEIALIDKALARIDEGTYGICEGTGRPISKERLEAKPWARYSREYAEKVGPQPPTEPGRAGQK